jgi:hypothetical protein
MQTTNTSAALKADWDISIHQIGAVVLSLWQFGSSDKQAGESAIQGGRCLLFSRCYVAMQNADALLLLC